MPTPPHQPSDLTPRSVSELLDSLGRVAHRARFHGRLGPVRDEALVVVALATGALPVEGVSLRRGDLLGGGDGLVRVHLDAAGPRRRVVDVAGPMAIKLESYSVWLEGRLPHDGTGHLDQLPLFPATRGRPTGRLKPGSWHRVWAEALAAAGLAHRPPSAARRFFAQELLARTGDLDLVRRRLGVKTQRSARRWCTAPALTRGGP